MIIGSPTFFLHSEIIRSNARILVVAQDNERNVFDQRWLEYELLNK